MKNLLSIGNSVIIFFVLFLLFSVIIVFSFSENFLDVKISSSPLPKIEINNFTIYQINDKNLDLVLSASSAKQFSDFEEFNNVVLNKYANGVLDTISAPKAIKRDDNIFFDSGVKNIRDGYSIYSKEGIYYLSTNTFEGKNDFNISNEYHNIRGNNIFFDSKKGVVEAYDIDAKLDLLQNNKAKNKE